jgi:acyl-CoA synthetase (AMP-forming)/AMP-acid ligase II
MSFYDNFSTYKNNNAVITETGEKLTYGQLDDFTNQIGDKINHRCLTFCLCENSTGSFCGYVSLLKNRIVPLLLNKNLNIELFTALLQAYQPKYIWAPSYLIESPTAADYTPVFIEFGYTLFKTNFNASYPLYPDLALLQTTSGSTGSPKFVRQSYHNIDVNTEAIVKFLGINQDERPITTLPMNHNYGLSIINSHLLQGATLLLTSKALMAKGFWQFFREQAATSFGGVPYTYEMLKKLGFFQMDLPSLKTMTQAGAKLTLELSREYAEFAHNTGRKFIVMYGQIEATGRMAYLEPEYAVSKCGSIGKVISGGELSLIDAAGNLINTPGTVGEIIYKGPNVSLGYAENSTDLIKGDELNGILATGDMAKYDQDGFFYITGRKKRFIKLYGNRINLDEMEQLVKTIVSDCACTGKDDHMMIYITEYGKEVQIRYFLAEKTGIDPITFEVKYITAIPKNEVGKTLYTAL